jgi:hypothetical protein
MFRPRRVADFYLSLDGGCRVTGSRPMGLRQRGVQCTDAENARYDEPLHIGEDTTASTF